MAHKYDKSIKWDKKASEPTIHLVNSRFFLIFVRFKDYIGINIYFIDMKKKLLSVVAGLVCAFGAYAVPAMPGAVKVMQPDGTYVTVELHGDEFMNYTTTADGYTVMRNEAGYYVYMTQAADGSLVKSVQVAHDASARNASEQGFLKGIKRNLVSSVAVSEANKNRIKANDAYVADGIISQPKKRYDYNNFHGLVILVEYNDCSFSRSDIQEVFQNMVSQRHYTGVPNVDDPTKVTPYTGSVRDYFYDNSMGQFDPQFDVVGPVKIGYSQEYPMGSDFSQGHNQIIMKAAVKAASELVDFSNYDRDNDGTVDMVYFIFAGHGANVGGNNQNYLWPHASSFYSTRVNGVWMGRYACSTEFCGSQNTSVIDGIGTICHEFSHVLGLQDEYDTDYEGSGGQSVHPGGWSVMAGGSYFNNSRTPVGYSLLERWQAGFAAPKMITGEGDFSLRSIDEYNEGYRINSAVDKEYFLLENRRKSGWNAYLPGSGMLVFRVDSTSTYAWSSNKINCNPDHNYYELIRANAQSMYGTVIDSDSDPFPGTSNVASLTNLTTPALKSWTGADNELVLSAITEDADGVIQFSVAKGLLNTAVENFENIETFTETSGEADGTFSKWQFSNANVITCTNLTGNGEHVAAIGKDGYIATTQTISADNISSVSFNAWNPNASKAAKIHFYTSVDNGETWQEHFQTGETSATLLKAGQKDVSYRYLLEIKKQPILIKIGLEGSVPKFCNIDDVTVEYDGEKLSGIEDVVADGSQTSFMVSADGNVIRILSDSNADVEVYDASGVIVARVSAPEGEASIQLPQAGFYIVRQGRNAKKVIL